MVWFKTDDAFYSHPKVVSIPRTIRAEAIGTWTLAGTWCAQHLTDGAIPFHMIDELGGSIEGALALVAARLWTKTRTEFRFKSWSEYQPTRAEVEESRESERIRKAKQRADAKVKAEARAARQAAESLARLTGSPASVPQVSHWDMPGTPTGQERVSGHPDPTRPDPTPSLPSSEKGGAAGAASAPSPFCPIHPTGSIGPCRPCGDARRAHDAWSPPAVVKPSAWRPGLCRDHLQAEGDCEMCEYENAQAHRVLVGVFGGAA